MDTLTHLNKTFEKISYAGREVKNREFEACRFLQCDLSDSNFSHSTFTDCRFVGCNLANVKLGGATLNTMSFNECKLIGVNFSECSDFLFSVRFEDCLLDYASFAKKNMSKTTFSRSSLKGTTFSQANLSHALFEQTDLAGAVFEQTNLTGANFTTAYNFSIDPELNRLKKARFSQFGLAGLLSKYGIMIE
jgi:fluoroquinolone resistance protein